MAERVQRLPRLAPGEKRLDPGRAGTAGLVVIAAAAGLAAGRFGTPVLALVLFAASCAAALAGHWRALLVALLLYLPFAGLPVLILYPDTAQPVLAKDLLLVLPAYVGALAALLTRRERLELPGAPLLALGSLALLVLVQAFNPAIPKPLVGLIGIKVWLFYLPLLWLGYNFTGEKAKLQRLLAAMLALAMIPCLLGLVEAAIVQSGGRDYVYGLYGPAAQAATQGFAAFSLDGGAILTRLPSIFQFVSQYWLFSTATIALGYAAWRGNRSSRVLRRFGPLAIAIALLASMTSGLRGGFIFSPFLLLLIALLEGAKFGRLLAYLGGSALAILGALAILRVPAGPLAELTGEHGSYILGFFADGMEFAWKHALLGLGTGVDSNGISYAFGTDDPSILRSTVGGVWWESWYLKAFLELGIVGLGLLLVAIVALVRRSLIAHRRLVDPELRSMSAAFLALFLWNVVYSVKTAYVDIDPMAIYIWLFLGVQWRLATMQPERARAPAART